MARLRVAQWLKKLFHRNGFTAVFSEHIKLRDALVQLRKELEKTHVDHH